ncbi:MAG: THUMP domain-containing protein, partial [Mariprofundaceae bacterium]|nr:THUMP domain-containing protein [Mariprofundaceae bacterium]
MAKILFHFGELSLKGKNRHLFEKRMARNIRGALKGVLLPDGLHREYGRMVAEVSEVSDALLEHIALVPGIRNFSLVHESGFSLQELQETARRAVQADYGKACGNKFEGMPFRVTARRSDKRFPLKSMEINYEVGGFLKTQLGLSVNLKHPQIDVHVEVGREAAYIYTRK